MKDSVQIVKMDLLMRTINEYFNKNPNAGSFVATAGSGDSKTFWKVIKERNNFNIKEVKTTIENFIIEANPPVTWDPTDDETKVNTHSGETPTNPMSPPPGGAETTSAQRPGRKNPAAPLPAGGAGGTGAAEPRGAVPGVPELGPVPGETAQQRQARMKAQVPGNAFGLPVTGQGAPVPGTTRISQQDHDTWHPAARQSTTNKELQRGANVKAIASKMPPHIFQYVFRKYNLKTPSQITPRLDSQIRSEWEPWLSPTISPAPRGAPQEQLREASPEFAALSQAFQSGMTAMSSGDKDMAKKVADARRKFDTGSARLKDPFEIAQAASMGGALTGASDATTKFADPSKSGMRIQGEIKRIKKMMRIFAEQLLMEQPPASSEMGAPPVSDQQAGLETNPVVPQPEKAAIPKPDDEAVVGDALSNKSLGSVTFDIKPGVSSLTIEVLGVTNPSVLEHRRDGTVVWQHRGQTKIFRPSGAAPKHKDPTKSKREKEKPTKSQKSEKPRGTEKSEK